MNDSEKVKKIKRIFDEFHNSDDDIDTIDVCIAVERIIKK